MECTVVFHLHIFFCIYNTIGISVYVTYFIYMLVIYNTTLTLSAHKQNIETIQHYEIQ